MKDSSRGSAEFGLENAVMSGSTPSIKTHERSDWMGNASNTPFLGATVFAPFGGERAGPLPGRLSGPKFSTFNFGGTDLRRTTSNFFLAYVLNKHHAYHDPSEIDFARPTQASSVHHNCERPEPW